MLAGFPLPIAVCRGCVLALVVVSIVVVVASDVIHFLFKHGSSMLSCSVAVLLAVAALPLLMLSLCCCFCSLHLPLFFPCVLSWLSCGSEHHHVQCSSQLACEKSFFFGYGRWSSPTTLLVVVGGAGHHHLHCSGGRLRQGRSFTMQQQRQQQQQQSSSGSSSRAAAAAAAAAVAVVKAFSSCGAGHLHVFCSAQRFARRVANCITGGGSLVRDVRG